jgi:ribosome-associated translation inhibitor RaiA
MRKRLMDVHVVAVDAQVRPAVKAYAREKVAGLAKVAPAPVLYARVTLGRAADPAVNRPATAEALIDLSGRPVRAQVSARLPEEAVDLLEARLRHRLEHLASQRRTLHRSAGVAGPGEWRHTDLPTRRPAGFPRPSGERQVVRHKSFTRRPLSAEEAAGELALLDYDFHLFTEASTRRDAVLWRRPEGTFGLSVAGSRAPDLAGCTIPVVPQPPPTARTERQAIELLDLTDAPFVFFVDTGTGRGTVVYRRLDGHYGLLTAAA